MSESSGGGARDQLVAFVIDSFLQLDDQARDEVVSFAERLRIAAEHRQSQQPVQGRLHRDS